MGVKENYVLANIFILRLVLEKLGDMKRVQLDFYVVVMLQGMVTIENNQLEGFKPKYGHSIKMAT